MKALLLQGCQKPLEHSFEQWQEAYSKILEEGYAQIDFKPKKSRKQRGRAAKPKELNLLDPWTGIKAVSWHS